MKNVFLISGKAMAGKDTVAQAIVEMLPSTLIIHNADYLKYMAKIYLGWNGEKDEEGRTLLQKLGTDKVRIHACKPMFWTSLVCDAIEILSEDYDYFCVPDTRFPNEIYLPKARFGSRAISILVERTGFDNGLTSEQKLHPSECALDSGVKFDEHIRCPTGVPALKRKVAGVLNRYGLINNMIYQKYMI